MLLLLLAVLATFAPPTSTGAVLQPRILTRAKRRCNRTRIATLNCRTLLADETLADLDVTLSENGIALCALQETRRDGFQSMFTNNYKIYWFGECPGHWGVGFAVHKKYIHLVQSVHPISDSNGRLLTINMFLDNNTNPTTFICAYSPPNTSPSRIREKFYSQLRKIAKPTTWLLGDLNARVGRRNLEVEPEFGRSTQTLWDHGL